MCLEEAGFKKFRLVSSGINPFELFQSLKKEKSTTVEEKETPANVSAKETSEGFNRVKKGYQLNKWFVSGKHKRKLKNLLNSMLDKTNLGDTIKVWATFE